MKRATIKDIAAMASVSVSTVSRALKDHPDIGLPLRNKIKDLAAEMNYHPNMMAVHLRKQRSNVIGLIIPEFNMFFFPSVIKGISEVIQRLGYRLMVLQSNDNLDREIENVRICRENGVDGLLMMLSNQTQQLDHLQEMKEAEIPVVLFDKVLDNNDFDEVIIHDVEATQVCTDFLIKTGCRRILGLFGNPNLMITDKRLAGFKAGIAATNNLAVATDHQFVNNTFAAWACIERVFPTFQPDGIFAMSDEIIAGVIPALKKMKILIPEQCSVLGISDGYLPRILDPEMTYLHHDGYTLGKMAATHLIQKIHLKSNETEPERLIIPTELIVKYSTR